MLAQTQVARVIPKWEAFLARWPDPDACAGAPVGEVIAAWNGLGYNRRAVFLHRAAVAIATRHARRRPGRSRRLDGAARSGRLHGPGRPGVCLRSTRRRGGYQRRPGAGPGGGGPPRSTGGRFRSWPTAWCRAVRIGLGLESGHARPGCARRRARPAGPGCGACPLGPARSGTPALAGWAWMPSEVPIPPSAPPAPPGRSRPSTDPTARDEVACWLISPAGDGTGRLAACRSHVGGRVRPAGRRAGWPPRPSSGRAGGHRARSSLRVADGLAEMTADPPGGAWSARVASVTPTGAVSSTSIGSTPDPGVSAWK